MKDAIARPTPLRNLADARPLLARLARPHVARALSFMDRDTSSPTYGLMDRAFWYYRTLTNFPGAVWQQPMVGFAALFAAQRDTSPEGNAELAEAATAALLAWTRWQHRGGAFDEWYRNEHSYCPTAITTAGAVITLALLGDRIGTKARTQVLASIERAAGWLVPRYNREVMNQNLAAAVALAGLARLGGGGVWRQRAEELLARIERDQSEEGWFPEYGGFDFGYSTFALDFLALASEFGLAPTTDRMAARLVSFLLDVIEVNKPVPGRIGSRGTSHVFPFGAISLAARSSEAAVLASRLLGLHAAALAAGPEDVDDRYFAYFYFPAFALAYQAASRLGSVPLPEADVLPARARDYPHSGLSIRRLAKATLYCSRRMGGALAVVEAYSVPRYHLGYTVTVGADRYSSAAWQQAREGDQGEAIRVAAVFYKVSGGQPLRRWNIAFQIVQHFLFTGRVAEMLQSLIKRVMIAPKRTIGLMLDRRIDVSDEAITVVDMLRPANRLMVENVAVTAQITMHSPSARQDSGTVCGIDAAAKAKVLSELRSGKPGGITSIFVPPLNDGPVGPIGEA